MTFSCLKKMTKISQVARVASIRGRKNFFWNPFPNKLSGKYTNISKVSWCFRNDFLSVIAKLYFIVQPLEIVQQTFEFSEEGKRAKNLDSDLNSGSL